MPNLDAYYAGGSTGAMSRAAQLEAMAATNAARAADQLRRRQSPPRPPVRGEPGWFDRRENQPQFSRPVAPDPLLNPGGRPPLPPSVDEILNLAPRNPGFADRHENRPEFNRPAVTPEQLDPAKEERRRSAFDYKENAPHITKVQATSGRNLSDNTIQKMVDDVSSDPMVDPARLKAIQDMANAFREKSRYRYFTPDEVADNPLIRAINDVSVWSRYRKMVADWQTKKNKTGESQQGNQEGGDGTFTGLVEEGSFASDKSQSALPPYVVARDEHGMLTVIRASQWYQGKFTDMRQDPRYAALVITALAQTSMYGSDSTANAQASRVTVDRNGNPVKAIPGVEDLNALASLANQAVIWQNNGDETSIDDVLAELAKSGQEIIAQNNANGDYGSGGAGRGYGGGGGGGSAAVRYTDATQLGALADSIGRQRMGRSLTPEEQALFVEYYHQMEAANFAAYQGGQPFMQLDPEGQAVAWVQNHFKEDSDTNQYAQLSARLFSMMQGSNPFGGLSG